MLTCPNCNNQQDSGKFCGVCGGALEPAEAIANTNSGADQEAPATNRAHQQAAASETADPAGAAQQRTNQTADNIKRELGNYWNYFLNLLKNPTTAFHTSEGQFLNGLITLLIFALASSLSVYFLANSMASSMFGGMTDSSVPFFSLTFRLLFIAVVFLALAYASALMMTKAAKNQDSVKTLLTQFGSLAVPFAGINVVAIITGLAGSPVFTMLLLAVSYSLFLYFVPVLFVYEKASLVSSTGHKVYISLATVLIMTVLTAFITRIMLSNMISNIGELFRSPLF